VRLSCTRQKSTTRELLCQNLLYPLRFEPIYQYRLWGGRHLANLLTAPLPSGPVGEAWLLSDRDDHQSRVTDGPLKGQNHRSIAAAVSRSK
jgi:mannose-6-phosphate isomerase